MIQRGEQVEVLLERHADEWASASTDTAFIAGARDGSLAVEAFERWLVQDRLFVTGLVAAQRRVAEHATGETQQTLLDGADGLDEELAWFVEKGVERGLNLDVAPVPTCTEFVAYLDSLVAEPLPVALTAIWTLERAYLDAWSAARPGAEAYREFVEHWANDEFRAYVDRLGEAATEVLRTASEAEREAAVAAFHRVVDFERRFWEMSEQGDGDA